MKCFNCGYELNRKNAEQCQICGVKFAHTCSSCGSENPAYAKFCIHCGTDLNRDTQVKLEEAKRHVAVLFADVSGFTALSEKLDPERVRDIINGAFQYITKPVYELEGTIDKYIGDCVMVLFGAKYSHKDDSSRAVQCALEMQRLVTEYSREQLMELDVELKLSIGINFGVVVTGQVGNYYDKDYTVIGDVVNTAQRLQVSAAPGEILVSDSVYSDTVDFVDYSSPLFIELKNKEEKEKAYHPISVKPLSESQLLLERDEELTYLNGVFTSNEKIVNVVGESGLGKTSLVKEFIGQLDDTFKKIWVNTSSLQKTKPFNLISRIISEVLNIKSEDSSRIKENRLRSFLDYILVTESEDDIIRNYNFLALILGLSLDDDFQPLINSMEYQDIRSEVSNQIEKFFKFLSVKQFIVLTVEDADLADKESLETLARLEYSQLMCILTSQSELKDLGIKSRIELHRFSISETEHLISHIVQAEIEENTLQTLYDISDGIPMLISELIQSARRKNLITNSNPFTLDNEAKNLLPKSLSGLILSKVDELSKEEFDFLNLASVIGDEVNLDLVDSIQEFSEDIITNLSNLKLIEFRRFTSPQTMSGKVYGFTQKIIKDTIYDNLLKKAKIRLHNSIGITIETYDNLSEHYALLAYHFEKANKDTKASKYNFKFAESLIDSYNYDAAISYLHKVHKNSKEYALSLKEIVRVKILLSDFEGVIDLIDKALELEESEIYKLELQLYKASLYREQAMFDECLEVVGLLENNLPDKSNLMGRLLQIKTAVFLMTGNPEVVEVAKKSEEILSKSRDYFFLADTISYAGISSFMKGQLEDAEAYFLKGLDYANLSDNISAVSKISSNLGIMYHATGEINKSYKYLNEAMDAANKIGSVKNYCTASINLGVFYMEKGRFTDAEAVFIETEEKAEGSGLIYQHCISLTNLGDLYIEYGLFDEARDYYKKSLEISKQFNLKYEEGVNLLGMAKVNVKTNLHNTSELDDAFTIFEEAEELLNISDYYRIKAEQDQSVELVDKALKYAKDANSELKQLQALSLKGLILNEEGYFLEAKKLAKNIESDYEYSKVLWKQYTLTKNEELLEELKVLESSLDNSLIKNNIQNES